LVCITSYIEIQWHSYNYSRDYKMITMHHEYIVSICC